MALTAAIGTAIAAICAVAALGGAGGGGILVPAPLVGLALLFPVLLVGARPDRRVVAKRVETRLLVGVTGTAALAFYVAGLTDSVDNLGTVARLAILAVIPFSFLWPSPAILRYCLLVSAGSLVAAAPTLGGAVWPIVGLAVGSAVALVALNRQSAAAVLAHTTPSPTRGDERRRISRDAVTLLVVAGLIGLLVAALLPPPNNPRQPEEGDGEAAEMEGAEDVPYLRPEGTLDGGGRGSGKGNRVVLRIQAPRGALWRSETFDRWDGRTWTRSTDASPRSRIPQQTRPSVFVPPGPGDLELAGEPFVQRVRVEAASAGLMVAAPRATTVERERGQIVIAPDGRLQAVPPLTRGAAYVVTSTRTDPSEDELRAPVEGSGTVPEEVARLYLQLPAISTRLRDLATEMAGAADSRYDAIRAVETWLLSNTEVALGTERLPDGVDPVERFLFEDREGSPEQVASSMVVLLRSLGIPSRLAVGFLPGDRYALGDDFVVREGHAHAWVEAWLPQSGWVTFDPTARFSGADQDTFLDRLRRLLGAFWWVLLVVLAIGVRWLTLRYVRRWQRRRARPWVTRCYERLVEVGRASGRPRRPDETPAEYGAALAATVEDQRLADIGLLISAGAFSGREPPAEARQWADRVVKETGRRNHRRRPGRLRQPSARDRSGAQ